MTNFADTLLEQIRIKGSPICVGIDPVYELLPDSVRVNTIPVDAVYKFCIETLRAVADHTPIVKFQSACFERYFSEGLDCLHSLIEEAHDLNLLVINDAKRGDIGLSAQHYAAGCLAQDNTNNFVGPDALTINSYLGEDSITPFLDVCAEQNKGLFALVRTSNPSGDAIQSQILKDGRTVAQMVASLINEIGSRDDCIGKSGYSCPGAVVGATKRDDAAELRRLMPQQIFLVPGYGAQGGTANDIKMYFKSEKTGALISASRSVIYAYDNPSDPDWRIAIEQAAAKMKNDVAAVLAD